MGGPPIFQGKSPGDDVGSSRSSNEDSAHKSDEEDIQESVEDVQESVKGFVEEATKEALGDEAVSLN